MTETTHVPFVGLSGETVPGYFATEPEGMSAYEQETETLPPLPRVFTVTTPKGAPWLLTQSLYPGQETLYHLLTFGASYTPKIAGCSWFKLDGGQLKAYS